jgi:U3 small nucleolar RNA-associated protein 22
MTALAKSSIGVMREQGPELDLRSLFSSNLLDYDVLIRLDRKAAKGGDGSKSKNAAFKNLQLQGATDTSSVSYRPVELFVKDLEETYGHAMIFFFDEGQADTIAALWSLQTKRAWKLKLGYSSVPSGRGKRIAEDEDEIDVNKDAILSEIARFGGQLVARIETR